MKQSGDVLHEIKAFPIEEPEIENLPLSFAQEALWFLQKTDPTNTAYNEYEAVRIKGPLHVEILEDSFSKIIERHESLRTRFTEIDGIPYQIISLPSLFKLPLIDLSASPESGRETEARRHVEAALKELFSLSEGPLFRVQLFRLDSLDHILLLVMPHVICDSRSVEIILSEAASLYSNAGNENFSPLPDLSIDYADYAIWQREASLEEDFQRQLNYWAGKVGDIQSPIDLPIAKSRPRFQTFSGGTCRFEIPPDLYSTLKHLGAQNQCSAFIFLFSVLNVLLYRYSGEKDLLVGYPFYGRTLPEIENLVGYFVNILVLRTDLSANPTFREVLGRVRETHFEAIENADVPFAKVVTEVHPVRDPSRNPIFQVGFTWLMPPQPMEFPGTSITPYRVDRGAARFDMEFVLRDLADHVEGHVEYNTDLFDPQTISRFIENFKTLLEGAIEHRDLRISNLPLLRERERKQILVEWNATEAEYPRDKCVHQLFEEQVERSPEAVALVFGEERLTYEDLNSRANQVARHLQGLGLGPEDLVGICMERSMEMVVGILGILKAGGAYVPLDPEYPKDRLAFMLQDAGASVLLTQRSLDAVLPAHEAKTIRLDEDWTLISRASKENPSALARPNNLSHVIYTSGSTGKPKGVAIEHRSVVALLSWAKSFFDPEDFAGVLASTSFCFDLSVFEMFAPLISGGKVILAENALELPSLRAAEEVTLINTVPSAITELVRLKGFPSSVRTVCLAGEPLTTDLVKAIYGCASVERVFDLYGPSEDTTYSTYALRKADGPATIGRPIANTQVYLLDANQQPVPVGVPGELHLAGAGLARGYLNRPELTAEKFVPNPFREEPGARMYKTGDLARYREDGNIEFLGRLDHQVKIRGYRIELGEIESVLDSHSKIRKSVVLAREDTPGEKRLVAYLVGEGEPQPTVSELRTFLKAKLPDYMVPSAFVFLEEFPLTPNGKIDRNALPQPESERPDLGESYVAPRTETEKALVRTWSDILGIEKIGIHDDFFAIGGHSISSLRVVSRINNHFGRNLRPTVIFEHQTIASLGILLESDLLSDHSGDTLRTPLKQISRTRPLPTSHSQEALWIIDQFHPGSSAYNVSWAYRLAGKLEVEILERALSEIIRRHEVLRTVFRSEDGNVCQVVQPAEPITLAQEIVSVETDENLEEALRRVLARESDRPFDLRKGPLLRGLLLEVGAGDHILLLTAHHTIIDEWSTTIFDHELKVLYEAFVEGRDSPLQDLPIQYADYASWKRDLVNEGAFEDQLSYWKQQLVNAPPTLDIPTDHPRPSTQTFQGRQHRFSFDEKLTGQVVKLCDDLQVTPFILLATAFKVLLFRYTHQTDIVIGTPYTKRGREEIDNLIGYFLNTLVLRTKLSGDCSFEEAVRRVRKVALDAFNNSDVPFERIVQELHPERDPSMNPFFQIEFIYQEYIEGWQNQYLKALPFNYERNTSHFDLELYIQKTGDCFTGIVAYSSDLFESSTIARLVGHLETLLEGFVADPAQPISELPILTEGERHQLLVELNSGQHVESIGKTIQELIEEQVGRSSSRTAVTDEKGEWSYEELNSRANQLAHYLRSLGVRRGDLVGIYLNRAKEMVAVILGVLKSGGAYLPLEQAYPKERLSLILADAEPKVLITETTLLTDLPEHDGKIVCLDSEWDNLDRLSRENPEIAADSNDLVYVIYTSGSTGLPKGVRVSNGNVTRLFSATESWFDFSEEDVWTLFHSIAFDFSVWEIWGALLHGGRLVVVPLEVARDAEAFYELVSREKVTVLNQTPSAFYQFITADQSTKSTLTLSLRTVIFGGEALNIQSLKPWLIKYGEERPRLVNMYGITETTVHVTYRPITLLDLEKKMGSVIGLPIPDLQVHLLDHNLNLVPVGVPGEIYVGGEGVAQGYLNRKELTAERFIPDPFRGVGKLYRSGDLARRLETGELEYIGRMDQQVQIRGFRVEMGEIENVLDGNPNIRKSIVLAREDTPEENRLVAYLVAEGEERPTVNELRGALREKLPDYMVPSAFVFMDKFPLTANGKIDKKALPKPDTDRPDLQDVFVAPRTETEKTLARIWSEVLGIEKIGIHDDFFDLGGHSLSTLSVTSLINAHYGCNLPPAALFEHKSIASVSALLNSKDQCNGSNLTPNSPETSKPINGPKADLNLISELMSMKNAKTPAYCNGEYPCRMRTSWICRWLLGPLYRISRRRPRSIIQYLILKLEGGPLYTNTLRSLYRECHDIEIGKYSSYWFDYDRVPPGTKVGNYSLIHSTGVLFAGNHPRNTVSVHPFFFNSDLDFSSGYEIPRAKIQIGNDVFIGHNSIVLFPTRRISDGAVIAAGSVVTGDVPPYAIMGGYPATILGYRFSKEKIEAIRRTRWWELSLEELEPVKEQFMLPVEGETIR